MKASGYVSIARGHIFRVQHGQKMGCVFLSCDTIQSLRTSISFVFSYGQKIAITKGHNIFIFTTRGSPKPCAPSNPHFSTIPLIRPALLERKFLFFFYFYHRNLDRNNISKGFSDSLCPVEMECLGKFITGSVFHFFLRNCR